RRHTRFSRDWSSDVCSSDLLEAAGVKILGTSPHAIQLSEDREEFAKLLKELDIPQPENGIARSLEEAREVANRIGYPVLVRPSRSEERRVGKECGGRVWRRE